jgi:hypothetical protein
MRKRPGTERENKIKIIKNHAFGKKKWKIESGQIAAKPNPNINIKKEHDV